MGQVEIEPTLAPSVVDATLYLVPLDHERQNGNCGRLLLADGQAKAGNQLLHRLLVEDDVQRRDVARGGILLLADGDAVDRAFDLLRLKVWQFCIEAEGNNPPQDGIEAVLLGLRHRIGLGGHGILGRDVDSKLGDRVERVLLGMRGHDAEHETAASEDQSPCNAHSHFEACLPCCSARSPSQQKPILPANVTVAGPTPRAASATALDGCGPAA